MRFSNDGFEEITVKMSLDEASELSADPIFQDENAFPITMRFAEDLGTHVSDLQPIEEDADDFEDDEDEDFDDDEPTVPPPGLDEED